MKHLKEPQEKIQGEMFHDESLGWWASRLSPNALRALQSGWHGVFRRSLLKLMPAERLGEHFHERLGRPTKELYSMAGLMLIAEFRNLTGEQAAEAYTFDASIQYALNLPRDGQYLSPRSVDNYRKRFREDELAQEVFMEVSARLVKELGLDISRQRLDSTHVLSQMARLGRQQLLAVGVKRFLVQLARHHRGHYESLPEVMRERYRPAESRLFGLGTAKVRKGEEVIAEIGQDMAALMDRFGNEAKVAAMESYRSLARLFAEHFEPPQNAGDPPSKRPKSINAEGRSAKTLQNPSDPDAGYNGKKGPGYQAQIAQSLPPRDAEDRIEGPGLIVGLVAQSASVRDNEAVEEVVVQQKETGLVPTEMIADTIYGSDENVRRCAEAGIELISPVPGRTPQKENPRHFYAKVDQARKDRIDARRLEQETPEWKARYAARSGIEGLNRALDLVTGFKRLRVRGIKAVSMALNLKAAGWNITAAAKILKNRRRKTAIRRRKAGLGAFFGMLGTMTERIAQLAEKNRVALADTFLNNFNVVH